MKSHYLRSKTWRILLALSFLVGVGLVSTVSAQSWPYNQDPYRQNRRDDRWGRGGNNMAQIALNQGYQDGLNTGARDAARRQSYSPQRSHFYRNGHGDNGGYGRYVNSYQFQQAYRQGFVQGYNEGYRRYAGYNRGNNGRNNRWPFPF